MRKNLEDDGFMTAALGERPAFTLVPSARVSGRVVTKLPGVDVGGLEIYYQGSRTGRVYRPIKNLSGGARTDVDGKFTFDGMSEGTINVFVHGEGENSDWTYRAANDVELKPGATTEVAIELIRGVAVEGSIVVQGEHTAAGSTGRRLWSIPSTHERDDQGRDDRRERTVPLPITARRDVLLCHGTANGLYPPAR